VKSLVALGLAALAAGVAPPGRVGDGPSLRHARAAHTATRLADGRVLLAGGLGAEDSTEIYDPATGTVSEGPRLRTPRVGHAALLLPDGRVLLAGGWEGEGRPLARGAEIVDGVAGTTTEISGPLTPRGGFADAVTKDGRLVLAGGSDGTHVVSSVEVFEPATMRFRAAGRMRIPRSAHTASVLANGLVLLVGGISGRRGPVVRSAELLDLRTGRSTAAGTMIVVRYKHAAVVVPDGDVLVLGGSDARDWNGQYSTIERWSRRTHRFRSFGSLLSRRFKLSTTAVLANGGVVLAGGSSLVERVETKTGRSTAAAGALDAPRWYSTATPLRDGAIFVAGGYDSGIRSTARTFVYRP
jgi:hypothetical protein